jgi:hypothetical protein
MTFVLNSGMWRCLISRIRCQKGPLFSVILLTICITVIKLGLDDPPPRKSLRLPSACYQLSAHMMRQWSNLSRHDEFQVMKRIYYSMQRLIVIATLDKIFKNMQCGKAHQTGGRYCRFSLMHTENVRKVRPKRP